MLPIDGPNDTRGWIMCVVSGIACIAGSTIICVDILIRRFPSKKNFRIEDSNAFLASSLSLSFGVMIFSALCNMLPTSKKYLLSAGWEDTHAGLATIGWFVCGFIGIQVVSRLLHRLMPSHVVDCDHSHGDNALDVQPEHGHAHHTRRRSSRPPRRLASKGTSPAPTSTTTTLVQHNGVAAESTPLLSATESNSAMDLSTAKTVAVEGDESDAHSHSEHFHGAGPHIHAHDHVHAVRAQPDNTSVSRRPSMLLVKDRVMSFVKDTKSNCDESGPCFGYTDPCGQECFKHMSSRSALATRSPVIQRTTTWFSSSSAHVDSPDDDHFRSPAYRTSRAQSRDVAYAPSDVGDHDHRNHPHNHRHDHNSHHHHHDNPNGDSHTLSDCSDDLEAQHHHHVPTNAFLSIGLQTVIAIALHKFPEGFITYATNMASPALGFNVFMALFVHNIAEGFSMALPLYMALGSRFKAIAWSSLLGGLSQPAGAAVAWLWFKAAQRSHFEIDNVAYAALFAVTAGIMTSVALQLFVESLSLNHSRNLSIAFAFVGMVLLGTSSALVDDD